MEAPYPPPDPVDTGKPTVKRARRRRETSPAGPLSTGQVRVAEQFAARYRDTYMHVAGLGWHDWRASHWRRVPDKKVTAAVQHLLQVLLREAVELPPTERDEWLRDIRRCESDRGLIGVANIAAGMAGISVDPEAVDMQPSLVAFPNGTYDLRTDEFFKGRPSDYITRVMGCMYDAHATCPTYDRVMAEAQPDEEVRAYVTRLGGISLEGRVRDHIFPVFTGRGGNGKGTIVNDSWLPVMGDYGTAMPVEVLLAQSGKDYLPERLALRGARMVVTSEPRRGSRFNSGLLKLVAGGDKLSARPLYTNDLVQWAPTHQVFMLANDRPEPPADDRGVWRRLRPVHWPLELKDDEVDTGLGRKLAGELSGIANRLLEGWRDYRDNGLAVPAICQQAAAEWRSEVDVFGQFLAEECERVGDEGGTGRTRSSVLFLAWVSWCHEMNHRPGTAPEFSAAMQARGFQRIRSNGIWWVGIRVRGKL